MADNVIAKISADISELKTELTKGLAEFKQFGERVPKTVPEDPFKKLKDGIADLGTIAAAAGPFVVAGQQAAQFEADLRSLNTIIDKNDEDLAAFGDGLRTVSLELGTAQGASASAQAAFAIAGSGFEDASDAALVLGTTLKAATAGGMADAAPVAETLSGTLKAFGAGAADAERFANVLFMTIKDGITTFPELTATLGNVAPIAASAGISIEELGAAIAVTTGKGIRTSTAVDGLKGAITNLLAPSKQAKDELVRLGVVVTESSLKQKGLKNTLLEIAKANGGSAQSFKTILGDVQAFNAALALTSDGGVAFEQALNNAKGATDTLDQALAQRNKTFQASMDQFKVALEGAGVAVGTVFLPVAKTLMDSVTGIVAAFATAPAPIRHAITFIGGLGAASVITAKAITLLTTAAMREQIALTAATAAKVLNTNASVALTAGIIRTEIALNGLLARTAAMSFSLTGLSGAFATARTATLGLTASLGPLVIAGTAVVALAKATADAWISSAEALDDYVDASAAATANLDDALRSSKKSAAELLKDGVSSAEVNAQLAALRQASENVKEMGLSPEDEARQLKTLEQAVVKLRAERTKLVELEKADAERKKSEAVAAATGPTEQTDTSVAKESEKHRKESLAADLHAIDVKKKAGELSARQEITALEQILKAKSASLKIEEKQRIEAEIAAAQGKIKADNEKRWEEAAKKSAETAKKAQEAGKKAAQESLDLQAQALETQRDGKKTIEDRLEIEKQLVDLEAQKALYGEKNAKNRQAILDNAKAEKALLEQQAADEIAKRDADLAAKRTELAKDAASEEEAAQAETFEKRRRHLEEEEAKGRSTRAARIQLQQDELKAAEQASKRKLELARAEAAARRKAADVDASPEQQKINAQREALDIQKAEREAAKESQAIFDKNNASLMERLKYLHEQLRLMDEAKNKERGQSFSGEAYGLDQINQNLSGWGVSKSRRGTVNQDGMTAADIEAEIKATEGRLGNRKETRRQDAAAAASSGWGVSKWDAARAADEKKAAGADQGEAASTVIGLLQQIARAVVSGGAGGAAGDKGGRGSGGLNFSGVPYQLQPNSGF